MSAPIRLGGFVIHGNSADTLARCLESLAALADDLVAVDSCSTDGSAEISSAHGFRNIVHPWQGYGAARAVAARSLGRCDFLMFLDSDEWLQPAAIEALRVWKAEGTREPYHALARRDWAELQSGRFLYRVEHHVRIIRADYAAWRPEMLVHETLPKAGQVRLPVLLEHRFATDAVSLRAKADRYALLWALRAYHEGRRPKVPILEKIVHLGREVLVKGSIFRGGLRALPLAEAVAHHHARKHLMLRALRSGAYPELVRALKDGRYEELHRLLSVRATGPTAATRS